VIRERTISVRFSRLMNKKTPAESTRRGRRCPQKTGGGSAAGWCSFEKPKVFGPRNVLFDRCNTSAQSQSNFCSSVSSFEHFNRLQHALLGCELLPQVGNTESFKQSSGPEGRLGESDYLDVASAEWPKRVDAPNDKLILSEPELVQDRRYQLRILRQCNFPCNELALRRHAVMPPLTDDRVTTQIGEYASPSHSLHVLPRASVAVLAMTLKLLAFSSLALNGSACMSVAVISGDTDFLEELTDPLSGNAFLLPQVLEGHVLRRVLLGEAINALIVHVGLRWVDVGAQPVTAYDPVSGLLYSQNTARRATSPSPYSLCLDPYSSSKGCGASGNLDRVF
jgi:hypothetical protein